MEQSTPTTFACDHCGKQFKWKPSIVGKKARCACGQSLVVPQLQTPDDPPDLYDLSDLPPAVAVETIPFPPSPPSTLAYATPKPDRFSFGAMTYLPRDIYIPTALLAAGFLATFLWAIVHLQLPPTALVIVSLVFGVTTTVKTVLLIVLALIFAPGLGVSFGTFRTAILKFAAIIIFTDAAMLWLDVAMQATGAISASGRITVRDGGIRLLLASAIIAVLCHYLFDMDRDDTAMIALPMAFLSRVTGFVLQIVALVILKAILAPAAPAPAAVAPSVTGATSSAPGSSAGVTNTLTNSSPAVTASPADAVTIVETAADRAISARMTKNNPFIREGRDFVDRDVSRQRGIRQLVAQIYAAGAGKVYFDLQGGRLLQPGSAYIELPAGAAARSGCFTAIRTVCDEYGFRPDPSTMTDQGQRFVTIMIPTRGGSKNN